MRKTQLNNGITIYYYPIENAYSTAVGLYLKAGSRYEAEDENGITHLLEHLHFRKLDNWSAKELYREMDKIGTTIKASTHKELLRFYMKFRPCYFEKGIEFIKKIITMENWTAEDVEAEKKVVLAELHEKYSQLDIYSVAEENLLNNHPLANPIIGTEHTVRSLNLDQILKYKSKIFSKENIALVITGNIGREMIHLCEKNLSELIINESQKQIRNNSEVVFAKNKIKLLNCDWEYVDMDISFTVKKGVSQSELTLLNSILGGGTGAKLQYYLKDELGLTYNVYSYFEMYSDFSAIHIALSTHKGNVYKIIDAVISVLNSLKEGITEYDMQTNLPYYSENTWFWLEDPEFLNLEIGWELFRNEDPLKVEDRIELYNKITSTRLTNIANDIFNEKNAFVTVVGAVERKLENQIKKRLAKW